jgi:NAD-dependent deacetylase
MIPSPSVARAIELLRQAKSVVALTGAGISTPSGIPDFRSPESGVWDEVDPIEVASIYAFRHNPSAFFNWIRPLATTILHAQPNPAHYALASLEANGRLQATITQNIDLLHTRAGSQTVYEVHGSLRRATCPSCHTEVDGLPLIEALVTAGQIPHCTSCHHILKPNVILFGELLPAITMHMAQQVTRQCDLMLVAGSSLEVAPAGDLPLLAQQAGARLIIVNLGPTHMDRKADLLFREDVAEILPQLAAPFNV